MSLAAGGALSTSSARAATGFCLVLLVACTADGTSGFQSGPAVPGALRPHGAVLVSGRIGATHLGLEAVLATDAAPSEFAPAGGPYRLRGVDDNGGLLFDVAFDERALASISGGDTRHFTFVVPVAGGETLALARVELEADDGRRLVREAPLSQGMMQEALAGERELTVERTAGEALRVRWNAGRFPLVQLRDPRNGMVLAAGRDGELVIPGGHAELDVALSDGVRSAVKRVQVR